MSAQKILPSMDIANNPTAPMRFLDFDEAEYSGTASVPFRIELFTTPAHPETSSAGTSSTVRHQQCGPLGAEAALKRLRSASLTLIPVFRALRGGKDAETAPLWPHPGGTLGMLLPRLSELELSGCLLSRWIDVAEVCIQLPWLKSLAVSNNRLRLPLSPSSPRPAESDKNPHPMRLRYDLDTNPAEAERICASAFPNICQLILVRLVCLDWTDALRVIQWTPSIRSLSLPYNHLGPLPEIWSDSVIKLFRQLVELDLTQTDLVDVTQLFSILGPSTSLESLILNQNAIAKLPVFPSVESVDNKSSDTSHPVDSVDRTTWFTRLDTLGLRHCGFADWKCMNQLMRLTELRHLLFLECPVLENMNTQTGRQEIIARLPNLACLNRVEVCAEERRGAELDYLKRYGAEWIASGGAVIESDDPSKPPLVNVNESFARNHPVFVTLCAKYGPPEAGETKFFTRSIKEGLISLTLKLQSSGDKSSISETGIVRRIPGRMTVSHLKMLARRLFKLTPRVSFDLIAQGERHRVINAELPMDTETREVGFYDLEDGDVVYLRMR
ncbi:Tubulin-specific chaperone E [Fasciola gigantica]|uniref:Tubulin-specific chaperone E n=1 Tax=Fasciola gigantica TaxID=46835 RepID=A0A504Y9I4_FASGI|nr:Tubulin-specific chaperone E [Fasciola gigantica]